MHSYIRVLVYRDELRTARPLDIVGIDVNHMSGYGGGVLGAAAARGAVRPLNTYRNNTQSNTGTGTGTGTGSGGNLPFSPSPLGPSQQQHSPQGRTRRRQRQQRSPATGRVRSVGKRDPYTGRVNVPPSSGAGERSTLYNNCIQCQRYTAVYL